MHVGLGSETETNGYRVTVMPAYLPEHSDAGVTNSRKGSPQRYVFGYRIRIANEHGPTARLVSRRWEIVDGDGERRVVEGEGVVGQQPTLAPGQAFEYSSFCPLPTPWGTMEGRYTMRRVEDRAARGPDGATDEASDDPGDGSTAAGGLFEIGVGRFYLAVESGGGEDKSGTGDPGGRENA